MPRKSRQISPTGIYHVMLRGINKADIFLEEADCRKFLKILKLVSSPSEEKEHTKAPDCNIYSYCLMTNHVHLLIGENAASIGEVMKRIGVAYVAYFNKKYERLGPLFQGRYKSEPVCDRNYYLTLLRYIHQNPIEAHIAESLDAYRWSSWHEFTGAILSDTICTKGVPFANLSWEEVCDLVIDANRPSAAHPETQESHLSDAQARELIHLHYGNQSIKNMSASHKMAAVKALIDAGVGKAQLARITGISRSMICYYNKE